MKNYLVLLLLLIPKLVQSQDVYKNYKNYYSAFKNKHEVSISELKRSGFDNIYNYNSKEFEIYKDSSTILNKIKYVQITFNDSINLNTIITNLKVLHNLTFIKFNNVFFLRNSINGIEFPDKIETLQNLETVIFSGNFSWKWNDVFTCLSNLSALKNIGFISVDNTIFETPNFYKLKKIEGIYYNQRRGPIFPDIFSDFNNLKSVALDCDEYPNNSEELIKLTKAKKLQNLILNFSYFGIDNNLSELLSHYKNLKRIKVVGKIKNPKLFFSSLSRIQFIKELVLYNNILDTIPKEIDKLKHLEVLESSNNEFSYLPKGFYTLTNLHYINIQGSKLTRIDDKINNLILLDTLTLYYNSINKFAKNISGLKNLKTLLLQNNQISNLPEDLGKLKKLEVINVSNNRLEQLPNSLSNLKELKELILKHNYIKKLPKNIGNLTKLTFLDVTQNFLRQFPNSISNLTQLSILFAQGNELQSLPQKIGNLKSLENLNLNTNYIKKLPNSFGNLKSLKVLNLSHNKLTELPNTFGNLENLETIYLTNRLNYKYNFKNYNLKLDSFKKDSAFKNNYSENNIVVVPKNFKNLKSLKYIDISYNKDLNSIQFFQCLKSSLFFNYNLSLDSCNITELPNDGWKTIKAKYINLSGNKITSIPKDIINAPFLTSLNLTRNPNKSISTYRRNKNQIWLLLRELNLLDNNKIPNSPEMAETLAEVANKKYYGGDFLKNVEYAETAISMNKEHALKKLFLDNFIASLFKTKNYKSTIYYADIAIKKDTSINILFLNSILPNFYYKAKSELEIGDTLAAVKSFVIVSKKFNGNFWSEAGIFSRKLKNNLDADLYFNKSFNYYINYINTHKKDLGYNFSLIEAYIISNRIDLAEDYLSKLQINSNFISANYLKLSKYFKIIIQYLKDNNNEAFNNNYNLFLASLHNNNTKVKGWSYDLFLEWIQLSSLTKEQKSNLNKITNLLVNLSIIDKK